MTCPLGIIAIDVIANALAPPPDGSTLVNTVGMSGIASRGRSTIACTSGSLKARTVSSALTPIDSLPVA